MKSRRLEKLLPFLVGLVSAALVTSAMHNDGVVRVLFWTAEALLLAAGTSYSVVRWRQGDRGMLSRTGFLRTRSAPDADPPT